jgi:hypothetical protein
MNVSIHIVMCIYHLHTCSNLKLTTEFMHMHYSYICLKNLSIQHIQIPNHILMLLFLIFIGSYLKF